MPITPEEACRQIIAARDTMAAGNSAPYNDVQQGFDDWAADLCEQALGLAPVGCSAVFDGWVAIPADDVEEGDSPQWCITTREFWDRHHYLDDGDRIPKIPMFSECMENTYEYDGKLHRTEEEQGELLKSLGFDVRSVNEWALSDDNRDD